MKCFLIDTLLGVFAIDESENIVNFVFFSEDIDRIVNFFENLDNGILNEDFKTFLNELHESGFDEFTVDNKKLANLMHQDFKKKVYYEKDVPEFRLFRFNLENQLNKIGLVKSRDEIKKWYKTVQERLIKSKVSEAGAALDIQIMQVIETIDYTKKSINLFSSKLKEWYGLHFPELTDKIIDDNIRLAKMVSLLGHRRNFTLKRLLENIELDEKQARIYSELAKNSMGSELNLNYTQELAKQILSLEDFRTKLEEYLEKLMDKFAPNIKTLVGPLVGAKLIEKAGGLKRLAFMPASRIQLLGAEKALFRFLRSGGKLPKHGRIFQWNRIRGSKPWLRGKISRLIAGKIGICAKVDFFGGEVIADDLILEIEEKIKELEKKYPKSPKKKKTHVRDKKIRKKGKRKK